MNVLVLNYEFPPLGGGAASVTEELATRLAARDHVVDVVTMSYGDLPSQESKNGIAVHRVDSLRRSQSMSRPHEMLSYLPTALVKSNRLMSKREYDVIHSHFIIPTGAIAYLLEKFHDVPYHVTAHGSDVPGYNPDRFTTLHDVLGPAWRRIAANAESVVAPSEYLGAKIESASEEANVEVVPNGFEYDKYTSTREKTERILVTSRLFERKGIQHFLDALAEADPSWDVVVTGEGPYRQALERKANRLDVDVTFTGWIDRDSLRDLLETSGIFVFPSSHENCPVSLQEAMAAGTAIVASRYSGTREVIGDAGVLVDPRDTDSFATKLETLVSDGDRRERLQRRARARVERRFDWNRIAARYERLFGRQRAASNRNRTGYSRGRHRQ